MVDGPIPRVPTTADSEYSVSPSASRERRPGSCQNQPKFLDDAHPGRLMLLIVCTLRGASDLTRNVLRIVTCLYIDWQL